MKDFLSHALVTGCYSYDMSSFMDMGNSGKYTVDGFTKEYEGFESDLFSIFSDIENNEFLSVKDKLIQMQLVLEYKSGEIEFCYKLVSKLGMEKPVVFKLAYRIRCILNTNFIAGVPLKEVVTSFQDNCMQGVKPLYSRADIDQGLNFAMSKANCMSESEQGLILLFRRLDAKKS